MVSSSATQTIQLGPNGPTIPALGVGTWSWGDSLFWQYGNGFGADDVAQAYSTSLAKGVNFFDTAEVYGLGESERLLGRFMQAQPESAIVATKYFPVPWRLGATAVSEALTASLKRLQVEAIALYQVHQPFSFLMSQKTLMRALADEVKRGRILTIGVSNYSASQMREAHAYLAERGIPLAVNQMQYSLLHRNIERNGILKTARELGVTILAYSPLAQGLLTGKYVSQETTKPTGARSISPKFRPDYLQKIEPLITALQEVGQVHDRTPSQVALNWLMAQGNVVPIPGAKTAQQAAENAGALGWQLTEEELQRLSTVSAPFS